MASFKIEELQDALIQIITNAKLLYQVGSSETTSISQVTSLITEISNKFLIVQELSNKAPPSLSNFFRSFVTCRDSLTEFFVSVRAIAFDRNPNTKTMFERRFDVCKVTMKELGAALVVVLNVAKSQPTEPTQPTQPIATTQTQSQLRNKTNQPRPQPVHQKTVQNNNAQHTFAESIQKHTQLLLEKFTLLCEAAANKSENYTEILSETQNTLESFYNNSYSTIGTSEQLDSFSKQALVVKSLVGSLFNAQENRKLSVKQALDKEMVGLRKAINELVVAINISSKNTFGTITSNVAVVEALKRSNTQPSMKTELESSPKSKKLDSPRKRKKKSSDKHKDKDKDSEHKSKGEHSHARTGSDSLKKSLEFSHPPQMRASHSATSIPFEEKERPRLAEPSLSSLSEAHSPSLHYSPEGNRRTRTLYIPKTDFNSIRLNRGVITATKSQSAEVGLHDRFQELYQLNQPLVLASSNEEDKITQNKKDVCAQKAFNELTTLIMHTKNLCFIAVNFAVVDSNESSLYTKLQKHTDSILSLLRSILHILNKKAQIDFQNENVNEKEIKELSDIVLCEKTWKSESTSKALLEHYEKSLAKKTMISPQMVIKNMQKSLELVGITIRNVVSQLVAVSCALLCEIQSDRYRLLLQYSSIEQHLVQQITICVETAKSLSEIQKLAKNEKKVSSKTSSKDDLWSELLDRTSPKLIKTEVVNNQPIITALSINRLVEMISDTKTHSNELVSSFIGSSSTFMRPTEIVQKFIQRYNVPESIPDSEAATIRTRVVIFLKKMIESQFEAFDDYTILLLQDFLNQTVISDENTDASRFLVNSASSTLALLSMKLNQRINLIPPRDIEVPFEAASPFHIFCSIGEAEIARQMTLLDIQLFQKITVVDFLEVCDSSQGGEEKFVFANNAMHKLVVRTNHVSHWMATMILSFSSHKDRITMALKFLNIAQHLFELENYNTFIAVVSTFSLTMIDKLVRPYLSAEDTKKLKEYETVANPENGFSAYRKVANTKRIAVPYIAVLMKDIIVTSAQPSEIDGGLINLRKSKIISATIANITQCQQEQLKFYYPHLEPLYTFLSEYPSLTIDHLYNLFSYYRKHDTLTPLTEKKSEKKK